MAKYFGKGIPVAAGFDLNAQAPLDARTVALNLEELYAMPEIQRYDGLMVYVESEERNYQLINGEWQQLATSSDVDSAIKGQIIDSLTSDSSEAALSARQGKVLKSLIDSNKSLIEENASSIEEHATLIAENTASINENKSLIEENASSIEAHQALIEATQALIAEHKTSKVDGEMHVPATGTTNSGKILKAGSKAGEFAWAEFSFNELTGKPTTLAGYGITDAAPKVQTNDRLSAIEAAMNVEITDEDVTDIIDFIKQA